MLQNTPLHEAAIANQPKSIELLLDLNAEPIHENAEGRTFLDVAIERSNQEAALSVVSHSRWKEILNTPSPTFGTYMFALVKYLPDVCMVSGRGRKAAYESRTCVSL